MSRCKICGQDNGHAKGCPNANNGDIDYPGQPSSGAIRCKNCNTMNPIGATKCSGCNMSLDGSMVRGNNNDGYRRNTRPQEVRDRPDNYSGKSSEYRQPTRPESNNDESTPLVCECGYPIRHNSSICPNCKKTIVKSINNYREGTTPASYNDMTSFSLGQCDINGQAPNTKKIETKDIVLGRDNLDPNNNHISHKHIHISNEDGQWYIEDMSSTKQTFIAVRKKMPLSDGDIVLLGNKYFLFSTEK